MIRLEKHLQRERERERERERDRGYGWSLDLRLVSGWLLTDYLAIRRSRGLHVVSANWNPIEAIQSVKKSNEPLN